MLILTRRIGENLRIGDDVIVTVLGTKGKQARIGITAPASVVVLREEIAALGTAPDSPHLKVSITKDPS